MMVIGIALLLILPATRLYVAIRDSRREARYWSQRLDQTTTDKRHDIGGN